MVQQYSAVLSEIRPGQDILALLETAGIPELIWEWGDDLCDCTFQRIGEWKNPYLGKTLRVRLCCLWAELYKQYPQFVQEIPGYYNVNSKEFEAKPAAWSGETEMPRSLWYRQQAVELGLSLEEVRRMLEHESPPAGIPRPQEETKEPQSGANGRATSGEIFTFTTVGSLALRTAYSQMAQAQTQLQQVMVELGLDASKRYRMLPDGRVMEETGAAASTNHKEG